MMYTFKTASEILSKETFTLISFKPAVNLILRISSCGYKQSQTQEYRVNPKVMPFALLCWHMVLRPDFHCIAVEFELIHNYICLIISRS